MVGDFANNFGSYVLLSEVDLFIFSHLLTLVALLEMVLSYT